VVARSLGWAEAYLTVREVLAEASTGADGVLWREFSGFGRFRFATLGLNHGVGHYPQVGTLSVVRTTFPWES